MQRMQKGPQYKSIFLKCSKGLRYQRRSPRHGLRPNRKPVLKRMSSINRSFKKRYGRQNPQLHKAILGVVEQSRQNKAPALPDKGLGQGH